MNNRLLQIGMGALFFSTVACGGGADPAGTTAQGGAAGMTATGGGGTGGHGDTGGHGGTATGTSAPQACDCLLGDGPYCGARAQAEADKAGCTIDILAEHAGDLLKCEGSVWAPLETCTAECTYTETSAKLDDACQLPICDCFVMVAWCGSGAAKEAEAMGCQIPLLPEHNGDILYCPNDQWAVKEGCPLGCVEEPAGTPDSCKGSSDYHLPWTCDDTHNCSNGNNTSTHTGKDQYAYDFAMPVGTTIRAMRGGKVLRVRNVSQPGDNCYDGGGTSCANYANTVEVRHEDGTVALYMHLSKGTVSVGQTVAQGDVLGKSGNSGWTTGPHLHTQVQEDCGIWWCQSIPFKMVEKMSIAAGTSCTSKNACP